ncbi:hypothetical protein L3Y34_017795 [Caenorhabditis briggsae]|uniref:Uncharacterized protein n=1 Tax=Caenorhabditis briggsae TaxID=6238 RepID=A0AAE9DIZ2_CAEBR|nr:hypothetical protein L3Y34_017795 [Caenorhabditis briggsae]
MQANTTYYCYFRKLTSWILARTTRCVFWTSYRRRESGTRRRELNRKQWSAVWKRKEAGSTDGQIEMISNVTGGGG